MVKVIKDYIVNLDKKFNKQSQKILAVAKEDSDNSNRNIYYVRDILGTQRVSKPRRINKKEYQSLLSNCESIVLRKQY
ncbi:MAG: hypothetical protein ACOC56_02105 [Atribacterota bacterium]